LNDGGGSIELLRARLPGSEDLVTLRAHDGRFIDPSSGPRPPETLDLDGGLVLPAFIEAHLHLDKALIGVGSASNLAEAIAESAEYKRTMTREDLRTRARAVIEREVLAGTTLIRAHTDVDPVIGLLGIEVLLELRAELADLVDLQIVAFPQEGVLRTPGTLSLLRAALEAGADVLGGCLYNEEDVARSRRQLDELLLLAAEYAVPLDLHADLADDASDRRFLLAGYVAQRVLATGFPHRVTLGHVSSWAGLPPAELEALLETVREAGIGVVALPATDMHLGGRRDTFAVRRGIAPVARIWAAGVACACATNNVRNAFTPYGNADPLETALFLAQTSHLSSSEELGRVLDSITRTPAAMLGRTGYGTAPGDFADFVVLSSADAAGAVLDRPDRLHVFKAGRRVAGTRRSSWIRRLDVDAPEERTTA